MASEIRTVLAPVSLWRLREIAGPEAGQASLDEAQSMATEVLAHRARAAAFKRHAAEVARRTRIAQKGTTYDPTT